MAGAPPTLLQPNHGRRREERLHVRHHRCGLDRSGQGHRRAVARADDRRAPAPRAGRRGHALRTVPPAATLWGHAGRGPGLARLAIIDVAGGHQPLANEDGIGVGRLQRRNLQLPRPAAPAGRGRAPVPHRTATPKCSSISTRTKGPAMFAHLNGMFALAIWDARQRQLLLARDRLGKEAAGLSPRAGPAAVRQRAEEPAGSARRAARRSIPQALDDYLTYQYVPHPRTIFRGIRQAAAGPLCRLSRRPACDVEPYWQPDFKREEAIARRGVRRASCASC